MKFTQPSFIVKANDYLRRTFPGFFSRLEKKIIANQEKLDIAKHTVKCISCKERISKDQKNCPHCGTKIPTTSDIIGGVVIIGIIAFAIYAIFSGDDGTEVNTAENKALATERIKLLAEQKWPFIANKVSFGCFKDSGPNATLRIDEGEKTGEFFGLNGKASRFLPSASNVSLKSASGAVLYSGPFIEVANELCKDGASYWYTATYTPETGSLNLAINEENIKAPRQVVLEEVKQQFSPWDGEHTNLARLIQKHMNNPDSYNHDVTSYWIRKDHLLVKTTYRGTNGFGAIIKNTTTAKISFSGEILEIVQ